MSLWRDSRRLRWPEGIEKWPFFLGLACILVAVLGSLLLIGGGGHGGGDAAPSAPGPSSPPTPSASASGNPADSGKGSHSAGGLTVKSWGYSSGQLAVVVRNTSKRVISQERVMIVGRDANGVAVLTSTGTPADVCCTVVGVRPGQRFGLFAEVGPEASSIKSVTVRPIGRASHGGSAKSPKVAVTKVSLHRSPDDTVVDATVTATGRLTGYVAVQAILVDGRGEVAQVISGRFYCLRSGRPHRIRMHLFHAVPKTLEVGHVLAQSIPSGVRPGVPGRCSR